MQLSPARLALTLVTGALVASALVAPAPSAVAAAPNAPATAGDGVLDILVLGDSYSAGNGATDDQGAVQTYGPEGCRRSKVNWGEKYAAMLRAGGQPVRLVNHACSGGVTADFTSPREMDTASKIEPTPAGVTTTGDADASLAQRDPCNTHAFPDEEFWSYHATAVNPVTVSYDCTRYLEPQVDFVDSNVDLVLFTMGGNDAGFSAIVQNCFVPLARTSSGCKTKVDAARALLPQIQQRLLDAVAAIRAHGLRDDATMVQLGYPWLQTDNHFTLPDPPGYAAGDQVRSLVTDGDAAIAAIVPQANVGHPGQLGFLAGVPQKFSGHEPDASTPVGNPARWINQVGDGDAIEVWYHPNRLGQTAYAELLGANDSYASPPSAGTAARAKLRLRLRPKPVHAGDRVHLTLRVRLTDGSAPRGKVVVRDLTGHRVLAKAAVRRAAHGKVRLAFRLSDPGAHRLRVVFRDKVAKAARETLRLRVLP
jgi:lysophospholipase L1-like esterase